MVSRAKDTHTTNRVVRIDDEDWAAYELACKRKGLTRSADIRMHIKREIAKYRREVQAEADRWNAEADTEEATPPAEPRKKRVVRLPKRSG
ncbi:MULTISPECIES: hypothetical protein [unclassified Streptomyces]|uniref:hypothetical protein n=1 Tax=unclassified Streptomyces TaxID=2593676 RepID=UPI00081D5ECA|nr:MULTISPECIES: hypothetical protein [unclassified Streptomyces]MYZ37498.1 hypothetical protein [Streptomyces sp. SID4917]SCF91795.1 hypothetical protein GA0115259_104824 [Streptomyces sp. MnatMP-M17]